MTEIVCIHGAFQGGWVWGDVAARLQGKQLHVHTPTLSGCGHLFDAGDAAADVLRWAGEIVAYCRLHLHSPATLVAHSFSGLPCAAALMLEPTLFKQAIFVDAVLPEHGKSFADLAGPEFQKMLQQHRRNGGMVAPWPAGAFGLAGAEWEQFAQRLQPFPEQAFTAPFPLEFAPMDTPCAYIACSKTPAPFIRRMAEQARQRGWLCCTVESSHCPMVSHPEALAEVLATLARNWTCW